MALESILEPILQGEPQTYSFTVKVADIKKGMIVSIYDNGQVQPATVGDKVLGIALFDAEVDDEVTIALMGTSYIARLIVGESQTINMGDRLGAGSTTISGTTTKGRVAKLATPTFTDLSLGATPSGSDINTAVNALIDEIDAAIGDLSEFVGYALEDKTTSSDAEAVIKVLVKGAAF